MIIWLGPRGFAGRVCTVQTDPDRESVRPGGSPDMKLPIKPMLAHTSQSQSGRGVVVLTTRSTTQDLDLQGLNPSPAGGSPDWMVETLLLPIVESLNPSPAGG